MQEFIGGYTCKVETNPPLRIIKITLEAKQKKCEGAMLLDIAQLLEKAIKFGAIPMREAPERVTIAALTITAKIIFKTNKEMEEYLKIF